MSNADALLTIAGLALITLLTRGFFLLPRRELSIPPWLRQGLRYAPLGALMAVVAPEVLTSHGEFIQTLTDPRPLAAVAAAAYYFWRRGILGTIVVGMAVFVGLRLCLG